MRVLTVELTTTKKPCVLLIYIIQKAEAVLYLQLLLKINVPKSPKNPTRNPSPKLT